MKIYKAIDRGLTELNWLKSYHSFSFGDYYDPDKKGFYNLRVINEDFVAPGTGFEMHKHWNAEIVTYLLEGSLEHKDSEGNEYIIKEGDVQRISAGTGIFHSEFNPAKDQVSRFLQIWFKTHTKDTQPSYMQKSFPKEESSNSLKLIVSESGEEGSVTVKQKVKVYSARLDPNKEILFNMNFDKAWIQVIDGELKVNETNLNSGDALALEKKQNLKFNSSKTPSHFLVFDMLGD